MSIFACERQPEAHHANPCIDVHLQSCINAHLHSYFSCLHSMVPMKAPLIGVIDQGTSSSRFLIFDSTNGKLLVHKQVSGWVRMVVIFE